MNLRWFPIIGLVAGCAVDPQPDLHLARRSSELAISIAAPGRAVGARRTSRGPLRRLDRVRIPELPDRAGRAGTVDANIVGGTRHSGNPEVAFLLAFDARDESLSTCTGTLIAPTVVVTAAHCIDNPDAAGFLVYFGSDANVEVDPGQLFLTYAESVVEHPDWDPETLENDIGLMFLTDPVPIEPAQLRTARLARTDLGAPVHLVGWGITGGGEDDGGVKRHVVSQLFDFDQTLVAVGSPEANTCNGDSGGPAFLERDGVEELIGVTSFGDTDCVLDGFSTRVDRFLEFIASGGTGGGGGAGTGDVGAPCVEGEECASGVCLLTSDGDGVCTDLCSESSDCPTGFGCAAVDETLVCIPGSGGGTGGELGDACTDDSQCASDLCAPSIDGDGVCSQLCDEALGCGAGFSCEPVVGGSICLPSQADDPPPPPTGDVEADGCSAARTPGGVLSPLLVLLGLAAARRRRRAWPCAVLACAFPLLLAACDGEGQGDRHGDDGGDGVSGAGTSFHGTITLDEYDWFGVEAYLGVIQIDLDTLEKRRFLEGRVPWRHPNGTTVFLQGCGDLVSRVAMADAQGLVRVGTPCSDEIENPGYSSTEFGVSKLSPDETLIAVEAYYYLDSGYEVSTAVYEVAGERLAIFDDLWAPTWTPDGQLLLTGNGFHLVDRDLSSQRRIDGGQLVGRLNNPAVHPSGERMVFEYNQQIWEMKLDGSELSELVTAGRELRFPTYSPDADTIVYLARSDQEYYDIALYFTDLDTGESSTVDLAGILSPSSDPTVVPNGPLSWSE